MINTISKTLEAQEKTQDIKQSPKHENWNLAGRKIAKKRAHRGDRTLDQMLQSRGSATVGATERMTAVEKSTGRMTAASDQVQKGSRAAKLRPDASGGM